MVIRFKPKTQVTRGIEVVAPGAQASEIATMIGAKSFVVDVDGGTATFVIEEGVLATVGPGQVISITGADVSVQDTAEFYQSYEADNGL